MLTRRISVWTVVVSLLLPATVVCLLPNMAQAQTMECCGQLGCPLGHRSKICQSTTAPTGSWQALPQLHDSLDAPSWAPDAAVPSTPHSAAAFIWADAAPAPEHSPPDLYTLHLALLI
jgi:hypothetical protein